MKKLFTLIALGSAALVSADQYHHQSYRNDYQDQCDNGNYYQQNQRQNSQGYYRHDQRDDRNNRRNNQYDSRQQSPKNQRSYQQRGDLSYNDDSQKNYSDNQSAPTDQDLNRKIQETLSSGWFSKGFQNVSFDVIDGNVKLKGSVDTLENKNKIEDSVKKINGVRDVNNQITVVKESADTYSEPQLQNSEKKYSQDRASTPQDRQLNAKIRDQLSNTWFSKGYDMLVIKTTNGAVVITGTVDKPEDVQKINDQIKNIEGVKSVNTQLGVKNR